MTHQQQGACDEEAGHTQVVMVRRLVMLHRPGVTKILEFEELSKTDLTRPHYTEEAGDKFNNQNVSDTDKTRLIKKTKLNQDLVQKIKFYKKT